MPSIARISVMRREAVDLRARDHRNDPRSLPRRRHVEPVHARVGRAGCARTRRGRRPRGAGRRESAPPRAGGADLRGAAWRDPRGRGGRRSWARIVQSRPCPARGPASLSLPCWCSRPPRSPAPRPSWPPPHAPTSRSARSSVVSSAPADVTAPVNTTVSWNLVGAGERGPTRQDLILLWPAEIAAGRRPGPPRATWGRTWRAAATASSPWAGSRCADGA